MILNKIKKVLNLKEIHQEKPKEKRNKVLKLLDIFNHSNKYSSEKDFIKDANKRIELIKDELNLNSVRLLEVFRINELNDKNLEEIRKYLNENKYKHYLSIIPEEEIDKTKLTNRQYFTAFKFLDGIANEYSTIHHSFIHEIYDFVHNYKQFDRIGWEFKQVELKVLKGLIHCFENHYSKV